MDENTYTVTITPNDFNAFITANGDGTYNVTYANLQDGQITAIGQEFANRLSDTDENGNSKTGLHKVALTGNYSQLENKPSASNLQGFHSIAFSGSANQLDNGTGDNIVFLTKTAFDASEAGKITNGKINEWDNKSTFSGNYSDLKGAPALPIDNEDNSDIYDTLYEGEPNEIRIIKPLQHIAFTNDYNDLINKPIYFDYIHVNGGEEEFYNIPLFGRPGASFIDTSDLGSRIYNSFINNKIVIIISYYGEWLITNCSTDTNENTDEISRIHYSMINIFDNYNSIIDDLPAQNLNESDLDYEERCDNIILNNLNHLTSYGNLIYDIEQQKLYCKFSNF